MAYKYILFDLDGTLTDSESGIISSVKYAINKMGRELPCENDLKKFIGPPLDYSFENYAGMTKEDAVTAVANYREYYKDNGIFDNKVYDGVYEMLESVRTLGLATIVATSKPEIYMLRIIDHFGLSKYFDFVAGSMIDGTRKNKDEVIAYILEKIGCSADETLMVGDRMHDIEGAHIHKIKCLAVLYGYGSREEFEKYGADYIAETPGKVAELIKNLVTSE